MNCNISSNSDLCLFAASILYIEKGLRYIDVGNKVFTEQSCGEETEVISSSDLELLAKDSAAEFGRTETLAMPISSPQFFSL
jgi:hypothetical protein